MEIELHAEDDVKGEKGAYFLNTEITLEAKFKKNG